MTMNSLVTEDNFCTIKSGSAYSIEHSNLEPGNYKFTDHRGLIVHGNVDRMITAFGRDQLNIKEHIVLGRLV